MGQIGRTQATPTADLQTSLKDKLADKNLDKGELAQLKVEIANNPNLSLEDKTKLVEALEQTQKDSNGFFFGIFGKGLSENEIDNLQSAIFDLDTKNPLVQGLSQSLEEISMDSWHQSSQSSDASPNLQNGGPQSGGHDPVDNRTRFPNAPRTSQTRGTERATRSSARGQVNEDISSFYVSQNGNGLRSGGGDCGPASAAMIAKRFGFLQGQSSGQAINSIRSAVGVTSPRNGAWAIDESEVARGISAVTGGAVQQTSDQSYSPGQSDKFYNDLLGQLEQPNSMTMIEVGSPYSNRGGRHYMIATGVNPENGKIILADPAGKGQWEASKEELAALMGKTSRPSHIMTFQGPAQ